MRTCRRTCRTAVLIIGLFQPLVIQAQPFGETEVTVFDTDFLPVPPGPSPVLPDEPPVPEWVAWSADAEPLPLDLPPPILSLELPS